MVKLLSLLAALCATATAQEVVNIIDSTQITYRNTTSKGGRYLFNNIVSEIQHDFAGIGGASFSVYGIAISKGKTNKNALNDIVGVHGTTIKRSDNWSAAGHFDSYDFIPGGTAIGVNIEFPLVDPETDTIGVNLQPAVEAEGIVGINLQQTDPAKTNYKTGVDLSQVKASESVLELPANQNIIVGRTDGTPMGFRYDSIVQQLLFVRNIGTDHEIIISRIDYLAPFRGSGSRE